MAPITSVKVDIIQFREASAGDLPTIIQMLADDPLGRQRENYTIPLSDSYLETFQAIESDPNNKLVAAYVEEEIVGFFQLTLIPYLTYQGRWRGLIEGVRVNKRFRGQGIGRKMIEHGIDCARKKNCHLVQLTTDKKRPDAIAFYESLGFLASHEGLKLHL